MSLIYKRILMEKERRNGLADQIEVPSYYMKPVEKTVLSSASWTSNASNITLAMPAKDLELFQAEMKNVEQFHEQPTMSHQMEQNQKVINSQNASAWSVPVGGTEGYQQQQPQVSVDNNAPQGSYYDCPIIIDPVSYQQQQTESFNIHPMQQQQQNLAIGQPQIQQVPCTNVACMHCKPVNVNTS